MAIKNSSTLSRWPWATWSLTLILFFVYGIERQATAWGVIGPLIEDFSFSNIDFSFAPLIHFPTLISYTFLHADTSHLVSNSLFFLIFGPAVERRMGPLFFILGYFLGGAIAALTQGYFSPFDGGLIGASGAISWAAGAFFVLFPLKVPPGYLGRFLGPFLSKIPAFFLIGIWFLSQFQGGFGSILGMEMDIKIARIAHWAHIGGFTAGALMAVPWIWRKN